VILLDEHMVMAIVVEENWRGMVGDRNLGDNKKSKLYD
jgi:hypothetical protein